MEILRYIFIAVLVAPTAFSVIFCVVRGKGVSHKMLIFFASMLGVTAIVCFGGEAILAHFDMGWRCTPFNTMLMLCTVFFTAMLLCSARQLIVLKDVDHIIVECELIAMFVVIVVTLLLTFYYFHLSSWHDGLSIYNNQTIVYANDQHGGSCSWRYYTHINSLVHGEEIERDGWFGTPPL